MIDKRLLQLPGIRKIMLMLAALTLGQAFVILGQGHFLAAGIVHAWHLLPMAGLVPYILGFGLAYAGRQAITWGRNALAEHYARRAASDLQTRLLAQVYALGPQAVAQEGTGNLVTMALDGVSETQNYIELILNKVLSMMIIPWVLVGYIFMQQHLAGIALLIMFPVIILFMVILGMAARDESERQYAGFQRMSNHFIDSLRGLKTLQLMGISKQYAQNVYTVSEDYRKQTMKVLRIAMLSSFAMDFFATLSIAVIAVFMGIDLLNGKLSLYPALVALILAPEYFMPIREFGSDYHATLNGKNALTAIWQLLALPVPQPATQQPELAGPLTLTASDLTFQYPDRADGIKQASFTLHEGQKVAIIGASGSGKSTLLNLIGGFLQPTGEPFTLNGTQLAHLAQPAWQEHLSYIPQNPYLFANTIAADIRFYQPEASDTAVQQAASEAGLSAWLRTLPEGLATRIGEGGRGVSGGQAQRIALARTLLAKERRIWLFDEPTAHLDIETESELKATMLPLFEDRLVIFATHRLHWLNQMDWVIVLAHGQIVAQGAPADLAAHSAAYQALVAQMKGEAHVQA